MDNTWDWSAKHILSFLNFFAKSHHLAWKFGRERQPEGKEDQILLTSWIRMSMKNKKVYIYNVFYNLLSRVLLRQKYRLMLDKAHIRHRNCLVYLRPTYIL